VILFGQGGTAVEVIGDRAVALPPLNLPLARDLISRTRVFSLLKGYRDRPAADLHGVCLTLLQVAQIVIDLPEVVELDINPLFADAQGVLALDARIKVTHAAEGHKRLAIRPYPKALEETLTLPDGHRVLLRPIRPEDEPNHHVFISHLSPEDARFRFFAVVRQLPHSEMARLTQIDYDREMAFIATAEDPHGHSETLAVVRAIADSTNEQAEFAIVVRSDLKRRGLGRALMEKMIRYCRARGTGAMVGRVFKDNRRMLGLGESLGFRCRPVEDDRTVELRLELGSDAGAGGREVEADAAALPAAA
jgi:acetyltransferase